MDIAADGTMASGDKAQATFERVCLGALSPDNDVRRRAEKAFSEMRRRPQSYLPALMRSIEGSQRAEVRQFCAVMLRQDVEGKSGAWKGASQVLRVAVRRGILSLLSRTLPNRLRSLVCEAAGQLAAAVAGDGGWPELLPFVARLAGSKANPAHATTGLDLLAVLAEYDVEKLKPQLKGLFTVLATGLDAANVPMRAAAIKAMVSLLLSLQPNEGGPFARLVPPLFRAIAALAQASAEDALLKAIESATMLVQYRWALLAPHAEAVVKLLVAVASREGLDANVARAALGMVVEMARCGKSVVRGLSAVSTQVIPAVFRLLCRPELPLDEWSRRGGGSNESFDEEDLRAGMETIDYLSIYIGGKTFFPSLWKIVSPALASQKWEHRHAGLMALVAATEGSASVMAPLLEGLVGKVLPLLGDAHPRVQWAALNAFAHFSAEFAPALQHALGARVLPGLAGAMRARNSRVAAHAVLCLVDFCSGDEDAKALQAHVPSIIGTLKQALSAGVARDPRLACNAIAAIAAVTDLVPDRVNHKEFMPVLLRVLASSVSTGTDEANGGGSSSTIAQAEAQRVRRELRANAIKCVGSLARAAGRQKFAGDAPRVATMLLRVREALPETDPGRAAVLTAFSAMAECLGENFAPFLGKIVPPLLRAAASNESVVTQVEAGCEEKVGFEYYEMRVHGLGTRTIAVNTALVDAQIEACDRCAQFARALPRGFSPLVEAAMRVVVPLIRHKIERVRGPAVAAVPALLASAAAGAAQNTGPALTARLFSGAFSTYVEAVKMEDDPEELTEVLRSLSDAIDVVTVPLQRNALDTCNRVLLFAMDECARRRLERKARRSEPHVHEAEREELVAEDETEDDMIGMLIEVVKSLAKNAKGPYLASFKDSLFARMQQYLQKGSTEDRSAALCCMCNLIEAAPVEARPYAAWFLPLALRGTRSDAVDIRHSSLYGVGVCAESLGRNAFATHSGAALEALNRVITAPGSREGEAAPATDNGISSVAKIVKVMGDTVAARVLPQWVRWLPCIGDPEEGKCVHRTLCEFLEVPNSPVYGPDRVNEPHILTVLAAIATRDGIADAKTKERATRIARGLFAAAARGAGGKQGAHALLARLSPKAQAAVQQMLRGGDKSEGGAGVARYGGAQ